MTALSPFADTIYKQKYQHEGETDWSHTADRVVHTVMDPYLPELADELAAAVRDRKFLPAGRYLAQAGRGFHQVQNCALFKVGDSREEWASLMQRVTSALMTGAGVGVVYSDLRGNGAPVKGMGGQSTGPIALMQMVNEAGRFIMQGGSRRSAIWAGLHWNHPDVFEFINLKDWSEDIKALKEKDYNTAAPMDGTNISVILDDAFFAAYHDALDPMHDWSHRVYWQVVEHMLTTAEPGFSVDTGANAGEHLRNACTEITSADDNDICNLGSLNMARIDSPEEMARLTELATAFLLCGTLYSKVPFEEIAVTREKNRRLGLGLMGIGEWLAMHGYRYEPNAELQAYLEAYAQSGQYADAYADRLGVSRPVKTRAIAPAGSIAIIAETTSGIEPIFATALKRRYLKGTTWHFQYVVDATAKRLLDRGVDPSVIEDAYDLAKDPARRLHMQAWLQQYVDHGISSTINLPSVGEQSFTHEEFGKSLMDYLPNLRGITAYPDGARGGQPLTKVPLQEALDWEGYEYEEVGNSQSCVSGVCGI